MNQELLNKLTAPFSAAHIKWRVGTKSGDGSMGHALPFIDVRVIQDRLDEVLGAQNWTPAFTEVIANNRLMAVRCALSIKVDGEWVTKEDATSFGAGGSEDASIMGAYGNALRRAAVQWGIGRYLYAFKPVLTPLDEGGNLASIPALPAEMLPEGEAPAAAPAVQETPKATAAATPAPAPVAPPAQPPVQAPAPAPTPVAAPAPSPEKEVLGSSATDERRDAADQTVDSAMAKATSAPAAAPAPAPAPAAAASADTPAAADGEAPVRPANLTAEQNALVDDLLAKMKKIPAHMIRSYVNGPKGQEKLPAEAREFLLKSVAQTEAAAA